MFTQTVFSGVLDLGGVVDCLRFIPEPDWSITISQVHVLPITVTKVIHKHLQPKEVLRVCLLAHYRNSILISIRFKTDQRSLLLRIVSQCAVFSSGLGKEIRHEIWWAEIERKARNLTPTKFYPNNHHDPIKPQNVLCLIVLCLYILMELWNVVVGMILKERG